MKTNPMKTAFSLIVLAAHLPLASFAQHTSGGGQGIKNADGTISLMDTVEGLQQSARCDWSKSMSDLLAESPEAQKALDLLAQVHAYAAQALRAEAERIQVCVAGQFDPRFENSLQSDGIVFRRLNQQLQTIAYRWNQKVIIDRTKRELLSPIDVAFLYIHETSHSFLPMNPALSGGHLNARDSDPVPVVFEAADNVVFSRRDRLWSFVHSIYEIYKNGVNENSAELFSRAITQNGAILPESDAFWKKSPEAYEVALNRNSPTRDRILAIAQLDWRDVKGFGSIPGKLLKSDVAEIEHFLNTWYKPAIQIMTEQQSGWEQELKSQLDTYGLDPFQVLTGEQSLMTIAVESQNKVAANLLATYPAQSSDRGIRTRYFKAIIENKILIDDLAATLARFDPNDGEMFIKLENGIQYYSGQIPYFVMAIQKGNWNVTRVFLQSGRVKPSTLSQGVRALVEFDMGNSRIEPTIAQLDNRTIFNEILATTGVSLNQGDLLAALNAQNEYAASVLLDFVTPMTSELIEFAKSEWANHYHRRALLTKALARGSAAINTPDQYGFTMADYAIYTQNHVLFDLLIQNGATVLKRTDDQARRSWTMVRLIENDAVDAITQYLNAYLSGVRYADALWLNSQLDLAEVRGKAKAFAAIQAVIKNRNVK